MKIQDISKETGLKYTTVLTIIHGYTKQGRVRPLLHPYAKNKLLEHRISDACSQKLYKQFKMMKNDQQDQRPGVLAKPLYRWINSGE